MAPMLPARRDRAIRNAPQDESVAARGRIRRSPDGAPELCWDGGAMSAHAHTGNGVHASDGPVAFSVDYPDRPLDRLSSALRLIWAVPIVLVLATVSGGSAAAGGLLFIPPLLMLVFRGRYPRWWFEWNLELLRFGNRVAAYLALMDDRYPSTEDEQSVRLAIADPGREPALSRGLPLVKWFLALPHYLVLAVLWLGVLGAVIAAWLVILFTGRYPRGLFRYVEGVLRWHLRVIAYAFMLVTDAYPPFRLAS
jgi:hypothetical protein